MLHYVARPSVGSFVVAAQLSLNPHADVLASFQLAVVTPAPSPAKQPIRNSNLHDLTSKKEKEK